VCAILLGAISFAPGQSTQVPDPKPPLTTQPTASVKQPPVDLSSDLEKMRVLIEQMQRNVAFVSAGDTPMKHQFQLEIELWRLLLRDMDRKINESGATSH
jgi:hypothetical protein